MKCTSKMHKATCITEIISHKLKRRQYKSYCFSQLLDVSDHVLQTGGTLILVSFALAFKSLRFSRKKCCNWSSESQLMIIIGLFFVILLRLFHYFKCAENLESDPISLSPLQLYTNIMAVSGIRQRSEIKQHCFQSLHRVTSEDIQVDSVPHQSSLICDF